MSCFDGCMTVVKCLQMFAVWRHYNSFVIWVQAFLRFGFCTVTSGSCLSRWQKSSEAAVATWACTSHAARNPAADRRLSCCISVYQSIMLYSPGGSLCMIVHHAWSRFVSCGCSMCWSCFQVMFLSFMVVNSVLSYIPLVYCFIMFETVCWYFSVCFHPSSCFQARSKRLCCVHVFQHAILLYIVFVCFVGMLFSQCVLRMFYHVLYDGFITFFKACLYRFLEHSDLVAFSSVLSCFCYLIPYMNMFQISVCCNTEYCIDFSEKNVSGGDNILIL